MKQDGIITTLSLSKYSPPNFSQRKLNGKQRIFFDPRQKTYLIKKNYGEHNHAVTRISNEAQHIAKKKYFCELECSRTYHCLQMANQQSVQFFFFQFRFKTFAYRRLAQSLNTCLSSFTGKLRENLDPLVEADRYAQCVYDMGVAAPTASELIDNLDHVFQQSNKNRVETIRRNVPFW